MQIKLGDGGLEVRPETPLEGIEAGKLYRDLQRQRHECRVDTLRVALVVPLPRAPRGERDVTARPESRGREDESRGRETDSRAASDVTLIPEGLAP